VRGALGVVLAFYRGRGRAGEVAMSSNRWLNGLQTIDGRGGLIGFMDGGFMTGELEP
jgi:hypothetical protein